MRRGATHDNQDGPAAGSQEALAGRIMDHLPCLHALARRIVAETHLAEDVVAQTLLKAWATRAQLREPDRLKAWLMAICRHEAASLLRARRRHDPRVLPPEHLAVHPTPDKPPAECELLDDLPAELKVCAEMFFIEGRSYAEVARLTGLPLSTIRGRIHLSRQRLREEIEMSSQPVETIQTEQPQILRPKGRSVVWRQTRLRLRGLARIGSRTLYDGRGKRLTRIPAGLRDSELFASFSAGQLAPEGFQLAFFCERTRGTPATPGTQAFSSSACSLESGLLWKPGTHRYETRDDRTLEVFLCGQPPEAREVRLRSYLWGPEDRTRPMRYVPDGHLHFPPDDFLAISGPRLGVLFISERRPGPRTGSCTFTLALSTSFDQQTMRVLVVDRAGREVEPFRTRGGHFAAAQGHLHGETIDVQLAPEQVAGAVLYPRFTAEVDWGRLRLPPPV